MSLEEHIQREMSAEFSNGTVTTTEDASANSSRLSSIEIDFLDEGGNGYFMNSIEIDFFEERDVEDFMNLLDLLDEICIGNFLNSTSSKDTTKGTTATAERKQSTKRDQISKTRRIKATNRERYRKQELNNDLDSLRKILPQTGDRKLTKIETFKMAYNDIWAFSKNLELV